MLRVLHILNELKPSGMEVMLRVSKCAWDDAQIDAEILVADKSEGPYSNELRGAGYKVHHFGFGKSPLHFWKYFRFLREHKYDVVHIHQERAMVYYGILAWCAGIPRIVRTLHNNFQFRGMLRLRRQVQRWLLRRVGVTFVSIGPSVTATEREYFRNPTVLIPNWFDVERFSPPSAAQRRAARSRLSITSDQLAIVTIGNCAPAKNHGMLLAALSEAAARGIEFVYFHIGLEEQSMAERTLAKNLGIDDKIRFLGWIKNPAEYLCGADLYAMCSTHEGFSIAALEAMGCGLPILVTDVPGLRDLRGVAEDIIWAELNPASIVSGIEAASRLSESQRSKLGTAMSYSVHRQFSPAAGVNAYAALYRRQSRMNTGTIPQLSEGAGSPR